MTPRLQKLGMMELDEIDCVGGPGHGLTAIVTGPTSGIGTETAAALARRGARGERACADETLACMHAWAPAWAWVPACGAPCALFTGLSSPLRKSGLSQRLALPL